LLPDCSSISQSLRSVSTSILGDASWINGNLEEAIRAYTEAIHIGREARNLHMEIIANSNLGDVLLEQGQLLKAADTFARSLQLAVRPDGQRSPLAGRLCAGLGRLAYERNQLEEAEMHLRQCIDLCRQWGEFDEQVIAYALLARLEQARGNPEETQVSVRAAEQLAGDHPLSIYHSIQLQSDLARIWLSQGNFERLSQHIQRRGLMVDDDIPYQWAPEYVILLRTLLARNEYEAALVLADRLLKQAEPAGRMGLVIEVLILQALTFQGKKETAEALVPLERAFRLARPEGYVRVFLDEGEAMTRLLCQAQAHQTGSDYAAELLTWIGKTPDKPQPSMQLLAEPLTTREVEVLKLIETGCSNQDIASRLVISIPTVKRHISNIYNKLGVESRTQAIALGKQLKLFE
jgi:ATP/maltotriose-dependent transcriptional regulator MalT